jgi:muconolactone D-isomerase
MSRTARNSGVYLRRVVNWVLITRKKKDMEFLTTLITNVPDGTPDATVDDTKAREAIRAAELAEQGHLLRLWRPPLEPGEWRSLGLWKANSEAELKGIIATLPLQKWMTVEITPLNPHPNDPASKHA